MSQFVVHMTCKVRKVVICEGCTLEQVQQSPFEFAVDEQEIDQIDWEITGIEEEL